MKRTILALGAAAALGLAGTTHAVVFFGNGDISHIDGFSTSTGDRAHLKAAVDAATKLTNYAGGVGHMLFAPYFSAQDSNQTIITIVNTDENSGKAVKVRFRSAANSDDLLDFTLLLSPGDVWTASVTQNESGLLTVNPTEDTTCTLPAMSAGGWTTQAQRLPADLDDAAKALQTREGYIEVLNMADIPQDTTPGSLYQSIVHGADASGAWHPGNCTSPAVQKLVKEIVVKDSKELKDSYGLAASTGGLFGSWWILNQADLASFSGAMTAIRAEVEDPVTSEWVNGWARVVVSPQTSGAFKPIDTALGTVNIQDLTADPLLTGESDGAGTYDKPALKALWYDLPDMSTPILEDGTGAPLQNPTEQIESLGLRHASIMNEYTAAPDYEVPMTTDWVVSQPTRRYYAAVDYETGKLVMNNEVFDPVTGNPANPYDGMVVKKREDGMPMACIGGISMSTFDREERGTATFAELSGGASRVSCGEVFTINFGGRSMLRAAATASVIDPQGQAGWGKVVSSGATLPLLGFAATAATNEITKIHYDTTYPHRWND